MKIGKFFRTVRKSRGMRSADFASFHATAVTRIERDCISPRVNTLERLANDMNLMLVIGLVDETGDFIRLDIGGAHFGERVTEAMEEED